MRIKILDGAEKDLLEGFEFYEGQAKGLGSTFLDSVLSDIESLHLYAGIHATYFGYHRLLAKRFPFAIYYKIKNSAVHVYAVLDCRRNPTWMHERLT